jgi:hypothetical protein
MNARINAKSEIELNVNATSLYQRSPQLNIFESAVVAEH